MAADSIQQRLSAGIAAVRRGDRLGAKRLLESVTRDDPYNEAAWMWLASVAASRRERLEALERVLEINPNNERAREALEQMDRGRRAADTANLADTGDTAGDSSALNLVNLAAGVLLAVLFVGVFAAVTAATQNEVPPTPTQQFTRTPLPTLPPTQVIILVPLDQIEADNPTLPPTWTPIPTPATTVTPIPSETPFPVVEFDVLFTSLEDGAAEPALFRMNGDGTDLRQLTTGVRDVVYDPSGESVAFVQLVTYDSEPDAEATEEPGATTLTVAPPLNEALELFVAPADNLDAAVKITELRTSFVGSPTWSPDGRFIVFVADSDGDEDLWLVQSDGAGLRRLTDNIYADRDPAWSPVLGSTTLVYASDFESPGQLELYTMEVPPPDVEPEIDRLTNATNSSYEPAWSPRGEYIAFISNRRGDPDVYLLDIINGGTVQLTLGDGDAEDRKPTFTPDTGWVAFISNRLDDRFQSYLISLDGTVLTRLTENNGNDIMLQYRPVLRLRLD